MSKRILSLLALLVILSLRILPASANSGPSIQDLLAGRPFKPIDVNAFSPQLYPAASAMLPAAGPALTEEQARAALASYAAEEFPHDADAQAGMLALFEDDRAREVIPSPTLRAGFAALKGTPGEPVLDYILHALTPSGSPVYTANSLRFGPLAFGQATAMSYLHTGTKERTILFNSRYQYESPFLFSGLIAHEALHADGKDGFYEELTNTVVQYLVYLHQIARHPALAQVNTELTRRGNTDLLALLNSGEDDHLGLYHSNGSRPVAAGSTLPSTNMMDYWLWQTQQPGGPAFYHFADTPGSPLLADVLAPIHSPDQPACPGSSYDRALLDCLDENLASISSIDLLAAANALKLNASPPPGWQSLPYSTFLAFQQR